MRRKPGATWHLDEVFVTLRGEPYPLWRAVDQHGTDLAILLRKRREGCGQAIFRARFGIVSGSAAQERDRPTP
jgi:hypothetical protein